MFSDFIKREIPLGDIVPKEGDLFKVICLHGKVFEIRYGFYEECDRNNRYAEPVEIYPDFLAHPQYTDQGIPFVTAMQNPCRHFSGEQDENSTCEDCAYYQHGDELLATCSCFHNKKNVESTHYQIDQCINHPKEDIKNDKDQNI